MKFILILISLFSIGCAKDTYKVHKLEKIINEFWVHCVYKAEDRQEELKCDAIQEKVFHK